MFYDVQTTNLTCAGKHEMDNKQIYHCITQITRDTLNTLSSVVSTHGIRCKTMIRAFLTSPSHQINMLMRFNLPRFCKSLRIVYFVAPR